ncbi:MAG: short-chain dehydrogenase [Sphingobacteriales bacterium 40-81]|nr:MAG: short-chain dehydrogenase [Sphingobacteriales bacterium 40-81]
MTNGWLKDKNIVIIGGTSGMGLAAAIFFIQQGANVIAVGKDDENVHAAEKALPRNAQLLIADAVQPGTAKQAIEVCAAAYGSFNGLFHVAGGSGRKMGDGPLHELTLEGWHKTVDLNLTSMMLSNQAAVQWFLQHKTSGTILNMGSVLGSFPSPAYFSTHAYAACKSAVIGFSKSIAAYYAKNNIRVNVIAPALVETPMAQRAANDEAILSFIKTKQPLDGGRIGQPDDITGLACYFMSDYSTFTTGQVVYVDGGWSISEGQLSAISY